jgi:peroxiredoxin (alkyl hydroperoxide reductase subunit C)
LSWSNTPRKQGGLGGLAYPLISDVTRSIAASYGALYMETGHTLRALYLIDPTQKIRSIIMNDLPVGRSVEEVIRLLQAFQHVEEHGELCPANCALFSPMDEGT